MERVIDRTAYRRVRSSTSEVKSEKGNSDSTIKFKKFLYRVMVSALTFLFLTLAKKYNVKPIINWIDLSINSQISFAETYEYAKNSFAKLKEQIESLSINKKSTSEINEMIEENNEAVVDNVESNFKTYEEAVEGVNQMVEDAKYIKEHFKLKHAISGTVTSIFGVRESDNEIVTSYHSGIDVAANKGTDICAAIGGEVITASTDTAYGKYIMIKTDNMVTLYAHCSELKVKKGQKVNQGEVIAKVGSTGWSTGPHLHFEIRLDDRLVDPADVLDYSKMGGK